MNYAMVKRLILKDWYLQRWTILGCLAGGVLSLGIIATGSKGGFYIGLLLLVTALIVIGAQVSGSTIVSERKDQTLAFVMSLPISYKEYTVSKIVGNLLIFLTAWIPMLVGSLALLLYAPKTHGLVPFTAIMATEILVSTCFIIAVSVITESQAWMIAAIMIGNIALNIIGYLVAHIPSIANGMEASSIQWTPAASAVLFAEFATIVLLIGGTFFLQSRKKDFL
jgi:ABC-2 type transport system permease protein